MGGMGGMVGRRAAALLLAVALLAAASPARAGDAAAPAAPSPPAAAAPSAGDLVRGVPGDLAAGAEEMGSRRVLPWVIAGAAATAAAFALDDEARRWFAGHDRLGGASRAGDVLGQGYTHAAAALGLLAYGGGAGSVREIGAGVAAAESLVVASAITHALKAAVGRERPGGGADNAFPSGHASSTAALAASVAASYDWRPAVAVPLGALTAFVAASRLADDRHWLSDVAAGAVIGGTVGASIGNARRRRRGSPVTLMVVPPAGIVAVRRF